MVKRQEPSRDDSAQRQEQRISGTVQEKLEYIVGDLVCLFQMTPEEARKRISAEVLKRKAQPKKRYLHYAIICQYPEIGQVGCTTGVNKAHALSNLEDKRDTVKLLAKKNCPVCKGFGDA